MPAVRPRPFISYRRSLRYARQWLRWRTPGWSVSSTSKTLTRSPDFPARVRQGIDASHAMLVWWSADYAESDHCLAEFRRAWQHARRHSSDLGRRVWVLNPEPTAHHIFAGELNSENFLAPPAAEKADEWARALKRRLEHWCRRDRSPTSASRCRCRRYATWQRRMRASLAAGPRCFAFTPRSSRRRLAVQRRDMTLGLDQAKSLLSQGLSA